MVLHVLPSWVQHDPLLQNRKFLKLGEHFSFFLLAHIHFYVVDSSKAIQIRHLILLLRVNIPFSIQSVLFATSCMVSFPK